MKKLLYILSAILSIVGCASNKEFSSVDAARFAKVIENKQVLIVDARTPEEFNSGHIPGAVNIDVQANNFAAKIAELDKSRPIAVYCRSGRRSKVAADHMVRHGLNVTELDGGILSWKGKIEK